MALCAMLVCIIMLYLKPMGPCLVSLQLLLVSANEGLTMVTIATIFVYNVDVHQYTKIEDYWPLSRLVTVIIGFNQ